jgi:hypothetical protein
MERADEVSVVAEKEPASTTSISLLAQVRISGEGLNPSVHEINQVTVDIGTDHLMAFEANCTRGAVRSCRADHTDLHVLLSRDVLVRPS